MFNHDEKKERLNIVIFTFTSDKRSPYHLDLAFLVYQNHARDTKPCKCTIHERNL